MIQTTLCYIEENGKYLMLHRIFKEKDVNKGKWIGVGGKFEYGESPEECLLREVKEETGLTVLNYKLRGILTFLCDQQDPEYIFLYTADQFEGELQTCDEGVLEWIEKEKIPELNLWEGDLKIFELLKEETEVFSLKLRYQGDHLLEAVEYKN